MANQWKAGLAAAISFFCFSGPAAEDVVKIQPQVAVAGVKRFGVNLGFRTSWGAEQLMSNVIMNPGFEGIVDRCLVAAAPLDPHRFLDQASWLARADDFWTGATFEVLTGNSAGATGKIAGSKKSGANGLPEFSSDQQLPHLEAGDRLSLTKLTDDQLPTQWWIPGDSAELVSVSMEPRPGSTGVRSIRLAPPANSTAEIDSYLDTIGDRAGVLLPITGNWRLKFWTRANGTASLSVRFARDGGRTWLDRTLAVSPTWQQTVIDFDGGEDGSHGTLSLRFRASGELLLDDVDLERSDISQSAFRAEVVDTLAAIRPAYIRDWQGQLGDTLDNRLVAAEGRRASRYRPGGSDATNFFYSLPEFLDLCDQVNASPWIVAPTTFTDAEWSGLGRYLQSRAGKDNFPEIVVEFGNENWNSLFAAAGITDISRHAEAASRAFKILTDASGTLPIKPILNAQYANPDSVARLSRLVHAPASVAVAPYFLTELGAQDNSATALADLFADDGGKLQQDAAATQSPGLDLSIYEVNMHTTNGDATATSRSPVLAGAASASALAAHLLQGLNLGARRQCVYTLAGFDYKLSDPLGYIPLWGVSRDLGPTRRMRPTGLALSLLNEAVSGDLYQSDNPFRDLVVAPFRSRSGWSVALASSSPDARDVHIEFPQIAGARLPSEYLTLRAASPLSTNEDSEQVTIAHQSISAVRRVFTVHVPPYGLAVLVPEDARDR